jgi:dihydrofolate reductase
MGNIVVSEFITLDGVIEGPGGEQDFDRAGWSFQDDTGPEGMQFKFDELLAAQALLLGRVTYDGFAQAWPTLEGMGEFGVKMNSMPKYVVSGTLDRADWSDSSVISGDLPHEVAKLKERFDGDILVNGSATLVQGLTEHDLVDEYRLMLFPVVLGAGKRLFADTEQPKPLSLVDTKPVGSALILTYQPVRT